MRTLALACACAFAIAVPAASAHAPAHTLKQTTPTTTTSAFDQQFVKSSIQTDLAEIGAGKLALAKSHNTPVRKLAQRLIIDHTKLLASAATLARQLGIAIPNAPAPTQVWAAKILSTLNGRAFNHWYSSLEVYGHQQSIQLATTEIQAGTNPVVRAAAKTALPILRFHLRLATAALKANPAPPLVSKTGIGLAG